MYIGIDIGGTKCAVTFGRISGGMPVIESKVKFMTAEYSSPWEVLERFAEEIEKSGASDVQAIGISCGGPLNSKEGIILSPPNLPGWDKINVKRFFEDRFGIKTYLQNDADACAVAEWKFGAARGLDNVVFLTFGTGLGAGLILNGKLYSGTSSMAGEIGHVRLSEFGPVGYGKSGSAEGFCSGGGIAQIGKTKAMELLQTGESCGFCGSYAELDGITAEIIANSANKGDKCAAEVYKISGEKLGMLLSILVDLLNPQMIVIGSVFTRAENLLRESAEKVLKAESLGISRHDCVISKAELGDSIGDYAAVAAAFYGAQQEDKEETK